MDDVDLSEIFQIVKVYDIHSQKWLSDNIQITNLWSIILTSDGVRVMAGLFRERVGYLVTLESWQDKHKHWEWPYAKLSEFYTKEKTDANHG
jgi:hypothetical protein